MTDWKPYIEPHKPNNSPTVNPLTHPEILEKAITKAIDNAWEFDNLDKWQWHAIKKTDTVMNNWYYFLITYDGKKKFIDAERIIYDHGFAQALWGSEIVHSDSALESWKMWELHLESMVTASDPIAYLGANI